MFDPIIAFSNTIEKQVHPVWILLGDIDESELVAEAMINKVMHKLHPNDIKKFDLTRSNITSFHDFLSICPNYTKIATCVIRENDDYLFSAILKRIEDIPPNTIIILIGQQLPPVLYTRGITFHIQPKLAEDDLINTLNQFPDNSIFEKIDLHPNPTPHVQKWLEQQLVNAMHKGDKLVLDMLYETWYKILEVMYWISSGEIKIKDSHQVTNAILRTISGQIQ